MKCFIVRRVGLDIIFRLGRLGKHCGKSCVVSARKTLQYFRNLQCNLYRSSTLYEFNRERNEC